VAYRYAARAKAVTVRHVSHHQVVALVEVLSPGNKNNRNGLEAFVRKAREALAAGIHLLLVDLFPPSARDPQGIHGAVWEDLTDQQYAAPADKPLTLAAYESGLTVRAYVEPVAVGDSLTDMPLYLEPGGYILVPLEATYRAAFAAVPRRWQRVLEGPAT
jgi:hypothetical protein